MKISSHNSVQYLIPYFFISANIVNQLINRSMVYFSLMNITVVCLIINFPGCFAQIPLGYTTDDGSVLQFRPFLALFVYFMIIYQTYSYFKTRGTQPCQKKTSAIPAFSLSSSLWPQK